MRKKAMTTEQLGQAALKSVRQMSLLEKTKLRRIIRRAFRKPGLYVR